MLGNGHYYCRWYVVARAYGVGELMRQWRTAAVVGAEG
jgi:hypothetical protein